jgi:predicted transporter
MPETILIAFLSLLILTGLALGFSGFARRSWGMVLLGAVLIAMPAGFASIVMAASHG